MKLVKIFRPDIFKIVFFLLVAIYFLADQGYYQGDYDGSASVQVETTTVVGYPYIYFRTSATGPTAFYTRGLLKNIVIYYVLVSLVFAFVKYTISIYQSDKTRSKIVLGSSVFYLMLVFFVLLNTFGGQWLNKYTERESGKTIKILMALGVSPNSLSSDSKFTPLIIAAQKNNVKLSKLFLERGADIEQTNKYGRTALHEATRFNALQVVQLLIKGVAGKPGANIHALDVDQSMPIHHIQGYEVTKLLLENKALANVKNARELTPIFFAPDARTLRLLITKGASMGVSALDGSTPIGHASSPSVIKYLVNKGASADSRNYKGETLLHRLLKLNARKSIGRDRVIMLLVKRGANVDIRDQHQMSPLHYAIRDCSVKSGKLLFSASREVRSQLASRRLRGQLSRVVRNNRSCWRKIKLGTAVLARAKVKVKVKIKLPIKPQKDKTKGINVEFAGQRKKSLAQPKTNNIETNKSAGGSVVKKVSNDTGSTIGNVKVLDKSASGSVVKKVGNDTGSKTGNVKVLDKSAQ